MTEEIVGWAILETDERDYILWASSDGNFLNLEDLPKVKIEKVIEYNQLEWKEIFWFCMCTLYAGLTMYSTNAKKKIWPEKRKEMCEKRSRLPDFDKKVWWLLSVWVKTVIDETKDWIVYRTHKSNALGLIEKGYMVNIGMYIGNDFNIFSKDKILSLNEILQIKDKKYGHSICIKDDLVNSYVWLKENIIKIEDKAKFINSWFVFDWVYLIVPNWVIRDKCYEMIKKMWGKEAFKFYDTISWKMYPREKQIFQYCLQMKFVWKLNSPKLKELVF